MIYMGRTTQKYYFGQMWTAKVQINLYFQAVRSGLHCTLTDPLVTTECSRSPWLSWMRRPTGDQEVVGSTPAKVDNILSWRLIMKYFLQLEMVSRKSLSRIYFMYCMAAGLGGSVGCAVRLETRRSRVQPPPRSATFFRRDWSWNIFYGHSLPSADSRRAVVSFWRKNVHNTG